MGRAAFSCIPATQISGKLAKCTLYSSWKYREEYICFPFCVKNVEDFLYSYELLKFCGRTLIIFALTC